MPKTNEREWERKAIEDWGLLVGPKYNQFDQEKALIKILRQLELDTIAKCAEVAKDLKVESRVLEDGIPVETYGYEQEYNKACEDIATAITRLKECIPCENGICSIHSTKII